MHWTVTGTPSFRLSVSEDIQQGETRSFIGRRVDPPRLWAPCPYTWHWISTRGSWEATITVPPDYMSEARRFFNAGVAIVDDPEYVVSDYLFNEFDKARMRKNVINWPYVPSKSFAGWKKNDGRDFVYQIPYTQRAREDCNMACLELDGRWRVDATCTDEKVEVASPGWIVSVFKDMETEDGRVLTRGIFYKLTGDRVLLPCEENRLLHISQK